MKVMTNRRNQLVWRKSKAIFILFAVVAMFLVSYHSSTAERNSIRPSPHAISVDKTKLDLREVASQLPLSFEPNVGQSSDSVKFISRGSGYGLFLTASEAVFVLRKNKPASERREPVSDDLRAPDSSLLSINSASASVLRLRLLGANNNARLRGLDDLPGRLNYFIGNDPKKWRTDVHTYRKVIYDEIYPGIDLTYYGNQRQLEYDFEVSPEADPKAIRLGFDSSVRAKISANGDLILNTGGVEVREKKPVLYQQVDGDRRPVEGRYVLVGKRQVGFEIGPYDRSRTLVIDPTLVYSTYLGGSGDDSGSSITVDSNNNVYVAGTTSSTNFPLMNAAFSANVGLADIFVTKIDAAGANLVYSTYVGGSGMDRGDGIAIDSSGNAFVVGRVDSSSTNFPTTAGSFAQNYRGGDFDGVVFKLNAQGNALVYSAFLGGEDNDSVEGVAIDSSGNAYVTGGTKSTAFPTTFSAYQSQRAGDTDAFLTRINSGGTALVYSSYLGGGGTDRGSGVAIDASGNAYLAGFTGSGDFPTENAFQNSFGGSFDAFVAKIDTNASGINSLVLCSYLGGTADEKAYGVAIDNTGNNIYVVGQTSSNDFPLLNPEQPSFGGSFDAFIAKITSAGVKVYATYLGGSGDDRGTGIGVNSMGAVYVTGFTSSTNFPTANPLQSTKGGGSDAFVTKLNDTGSALVYSTYLGGSANENSVSTVTSTNPLALDSSGNAYITGYSASTNFPTASPFQAANAGGATDAFVAKISDATLSADFSVSVNPASQTVNPGNATSYNLTITPVSGFIGNVGLSINGVPANTTASFNPASVNLTDANAGTSVLTITTTASTPAGTHVLTVTGTSGSLQHSTSPNLIVAGATSANLSVTKTASPNPAIVTSNLTYRIIVTNTGPSPATNVAVTDPLPAGVNFVSATPTQGTCSGTTTVTCNLGTLASGSAATVSIVCVPQATGQLSNTASASATESDPNPNDNSVTVITPITTQSSGPSMLDPNLSVRTVVTGLSQPTSMAFLGLNDFFILEKDTGKVKRVVNGVVQSTVLDLAVNNASERGLLGIALHPGFRNNGYVYLYWTESSTGVDSSNLQDVALLGNRVDRYVWNGSALIFDRNVIKLHAFQADANQPLRGNHNGGVLRFGPDGKLFIMMGDNGRRGFLQNATSGAPVPDDQFGGPEPDNAHLTGFILRLNDDGSTPSDNPFFNASTNLTGEAAANIKKLFAYGVRNGFGLAFDPLSGNLWDQENGDDAFDEMNRITAGSNNGWVQIMGPVSRINQYKQIESTYGAGNLQQLRWSPSLIADTPADALSRLYMLPGARYNDPEFSWKYAVPAAPLGFVQGRGIGPQFEGDMFVGAARTFLAGGFLFRFKLTPDRLHFSFTDSRLTDLVADNLDKFDITESESLLIGKDFGITTDIESGPNGNVFVVSNTNSAVYEISGRQPTVFVANLNGAQEVPPNNSTATGTATLLLSPDELSARLSLNFKGLISPETVAHIHGPAAPGNVGPVLFPIAQGNLSDVVLTLGPADVQNLRNGLLYIDIHSNAFTAGEIRGHFQTSTTASSVQFNSASYSVNEGGADGTLLVTRVGDTTSPATVDYATADTAGANNCNVVNGAASSRCDYLTTSGTLQFAAGEVSKTISVPIVDDVYAEGSESLTITLSSPTGTTLGSPATATLTITENDIVNGSTNPIDQAAGFVRQHYVDFLNREPDTSGLGFWTNEITQCGSDTACIDVKRINVSAAFFLSIEFQQTGYLVYRMYKAAYGNLPGAPVPLRLDEFLPDTQQIGLGVIVGQTGWEQQLESNKQAFAMTFVSRPRFSTAFPTTMTPAQFVDALFVNAGVTPTASERTAAINEFGGAGNSADLAARARALRLIAENATLVQQEFNKAFVLMEYFGYLRRNPNDVPDTNFSGYNFWLAKLNQFGGNFINAELVKAFIVSTEYRQRFGP